MPCESADPPTCRDPPFEIMLCESADPLTCRGPKSATQTVKTNVLIWWKIRFSLAGAGGWGPHAPATPPLRWLAGAGVSMHFWLAGAGGPRPPAPASGKPPPTPYPCDSTEPLTCRRRGSPPPPTCESKFVFFSISNLDCIFKHLKIKIVSTSLTLLGSSNQRQLSLYLSFTKATTSLTLLGSSMGCPLILEPQDFDRIYLTSSYEVIDCV